MDEKDHKTDEGPPSKKIRLSSTEPGSFSDLTWNLLNQFNSELPEELGNLTTIATSEMNSSDVNANALQMFSNQSTTVPNVSMLSLQSSAASQSLKISGLSLSNAGTVPAGIPMQRFQTVAGMLGPGQNRHPSGIHLPSSSVNIGNVVTNLAGRTNSSVVSTLGNVLKMYRPQSNVMTVVANCQTNAALPLSQNNLTGFVVTGSTAAAPNRMVMNVNSGNQPAVMIQTSSIAPFSAALTTHQKVPLTAGSGCFNVMVTNADSLPVPQQLTMSHQGNHLPVRPLAPLQIPGQSSNMTNSTELHQVRKPAGADRRKCCLIQQQLVLLLHAHKCQRREEENGTSSKLTGCTVPHCRTMKDVLKHMGECVLGKSCKIPHCASSRQIITHWKNCTRSDCSVCRPLKSAQDKRPISSTTLMQPLTNKSLPSNPDASMDPHNADLARAYRALGLSPPTITQSKQQELPVPPNPLAVCSASGINSTLNANGGSTWQATAAKDPKTTGPIRLTGDNMVAVETGGAQDVGIRVGTACDTVSEMPSQTPNERLKGWRDSVTSDLRNHLVYKLVQAIFPRPDQSALQDRRISNLVIYARKVEADMYDIATSKEQYYLLLAEKIYKIQKELEEKRLKRVLNTVPLAGGGDQMTFSGAAASLSPQPLYSRVPRTGMSSSSSSVVDQYFNGPAGLHLLDGAAVSNGMAVAGDAVSIYGVPTTLTTVTQDLPKEEQQKAQVNINMPISQAMNTASSGMMQGFISDPLVTQASVNSVEFKNSGTDVPLQQSSEAETEDMKTEMKIDMKSDFQDDMPLQNESLGAESNSRPVDGMNETKNLKMEIPESSNFPLESGVDGAKTDADTDTAAASNPVNKKCWKLNELRQNLMPVLEKLYRMEPESIPFRQPVDPVQLQIPDYFSIVKKPMDLSTIKRKLDTGQYTDPWQFVDDVWLMFENAWLYNRRSSKIHKFCTKLSEIFEPEIDRVMKMLGFCCGRKYVFCPQVLCCFGKPMCTIAVGAPYYSYQNRYVYCEKCFTEFEEYEVELVDDPSQPGTRVKKNLFSRLTNNDMEPEKFVVCSYCGCKHHQICSLYMEQISSTNFVCDACSSVNNIPKKINKYTAKKLPQTKLGAYLENRVNSFLKIKDAGAGEVSIRVLSSSEKAAEVKPGMKARYCNNNEFPTSFPYVAKAIFAFEEIDGTDVCFFGMHVQEYGSNSPAPNSRHVYLAYLDSVNFFKPKHLRTTAYHEILIGYLDYVKILGYVAVHIWACPPCEGDDYIFHCHPPEMKIPKPKRLQEWYRKMLDKAIIERIVIDYKDVLRDAKEANIQDVTQIPYFEGDFWPNVLEESIKELEQGEERRKHEQAEAVLGLDSENPNPEIEEVAEVTQTGKKKGQKGVGSKKKNTKNKNSSHRKVGKKYSQMHGGYDLVQKLFLMMEKHREVFFVVRLHSHQVTCGLPPINDPDPLVTNDLMDGRDNFLMMAREKHYEFSSLRRAKFSTIAMLHELHTQGRDNFVYTCNNCKANIETHYHCNTCDDFDLCVLCYKKEKHPHPLEKCGLDLDEGNEGTAEGKEVHQLNPMKSRRESIQRCIQSLCHASQCHDANCSTPSCAKMKRVIQHARFCRRKTSTSCQICKQLIALCCYHAKSCSEPKCVVPFCLQIRQKLHQQQVQQRFHQSQMIRRRMAVMHHYPTPPTAQVDLHSILPLSQTTVASMSTEVTPNCFKEKQISSTLLEDKRVELIAQQQDVPSGCQPGQSGPEKATFTVKPAVGQSQDVFVGEEFNKQKCLLSPLSQFTSSQSTGKPITVAIATACTTAVTAYAATSASSSVLQQPLLFQKLLASMKMSAGNEQQQQQLLKLLARTHPQLLATFIKQMYANNCKRLESAAVSTNQQTSVNTMSFPSTSINQQAQMLKLPAQVMATSSQGTLLSVPAQEAPCATTVQQAVISLTPAQKKMLGMSALEHGIGVSPGNLINNGIDQRRPSVQNRFPQHHLQQVSLQHQQQQRMPRNTVVGMPATTIQSTRLQTNLNFCHPSIATRAAPSLTLSNPVLHKQQPVVMVTVTEAGSQRLSTTNVVLNRLPSMGAIVSQAQRLSYQLKSPMMTANPQLSSSAPAFQQSSLTSQSLPNLRTAYHFPVLAIHAVPSSSEGATMLPTDRPGSSDQVMLSQLQSSYQVNNASNIITLTPQDQLSHYVEQL